jgi:muramidase (phage lysozyme)
MKATEKQWEQIKSTVKTVFGKDFQCKKMTAVKQYQIYGRDGMNILQAEMLYNLLKKLGFTWTEFDNYYRNNPIHKNTNTIHADFDIIK